MAITKANFTWTSSLPWAASAGDTAGPAYFIHSKLTAWMAATTGMSSMLTIQVNPFQCTTFNSGTEVGWLFAFPENSGAYFRWGARAGNTATSPSSSAQHWWGWTAGSSNNNMGSNTLSRAANATQWIDAPTSTTNVGISVVYDNDSSLPWFAVISYTSSTMQQMRMQVIARLDTSSASLGAGVSYPSQASKWCFFNLYPPGNNGLIEYAVPTSSSASPGYGTGLSGYLFAPRNGFFGGPGNSGVLAEATTGWGETHPVGRVNPNLFRTSATNYGQPGEQLTISSGTYVRINPVGSNFVNGLWLRTA